MQVIRDPENEQGLSGAVQSTFLETVHQPVCQIAASVCESSFSRQDVLPEQKLYLFGALLPLLQLFTSLADSFPETQVFCGRPGASCFGTLQNDALAMSLRCS